MISRSSRSSRSGGGGGELSRSSHQKSSRSSSVDQELLEFLKKSSSNRNLVEEKKDDETKKSSSRCRKSGTRKSSSSSCNKDPEASKFEMALCVWQYLKNNHFHFTADTMQQEWTKNNKSNGGSLNKANCERIQLELAFKSTTNNQNDHDDDDDDSDGSSRGSEEGSGRGGRDNGDESSEDEKEEAKKKAMLGRPHLGGNSSSSRDGGNRRPSISRAGSVSKIEMKPNVSSRSLSLAGGGSSHGSGGSTSGRPSLAAGGSSHGDRRPSLAGGRNHGSSGHGGGGGGGRRASLANGRTQSERNMRTTAVSMYPTALMADDVDDDEDDTGLDYGKPHMTAMTPSCTSFARLGGPAGQNHLIGRTQSERNLNKTRIQQETEYQSNAAEEMIKMMNDSLSDLYKSTVLPSPSCLLKNQSLDLDMAKYAGPTLTITNQVAQNAKERRTTAL
jgi:hypothetical protein